MWLVIVFVLGIAVRVFFFDLPMIHDEGGYALAARGWFEGTGELYNDLWISRPQGIFVLYGITMKTFGYGVAAFRTMAWIFATGTVLATWLYARRWTTTRTALLIAFVCTLLLGSPTLEGYTANAEVFAGMPAAFAAFWLLRQAQTGWTTRGLVSIGVLIGLSTVLKPSGGTMWLAAIAFLLIYGKDARRDHYKRCGWVTFGVGIVAIVTFIHGWTLGWDNFFYATITYRFVQQSALSYGWLHNLKQIGWMLVNAAEFFLLIMLVWIFRIRLPLVPVLGKPRQPIATDSPAVIPIWTPLLRRLQNSRFLHTDDPGSLLLALWIVAAVIGIFMGGDYWTHYLILLAPPVSLWLARNIEGITRALAGWRKALAMAMFSILLILPYAVALDGTDGIYERLYRHPGYPAQAAVARYIRENTEPNQTIYVAFDQASIYYLADRKPAYRHLYDQELTALPNSYADIIAILNSDNRPVYIISTLHPGPFPDQSKAFWREVSRFYDLEIMIDGVPIYRVKPGLRFAGDGITASRWAPQLQVLVCDSRPPHQESAFAHGAARPIAR